MNIEPNERWFRVTLQNGGQSCTEIAHVEPAGDRRVLAIG
jgi:hypothetical protein